MGACLGRRKEHRMVILGLDAAGKTTILYYFAHGDVVSAVPTVGFNAEGFEHNGVIFDAWDVGGQEKIRALWRHYFKGTDVLVFVLDSTDRARFKEARDELHSLLNEELLRNAILLVYLNKQDLPNPLTEAEAIEKLNLNSLPEDRRWHLQPCSAINKEGVREGLDWVVQQIHSR